MHVDGLRLDAVHALVIASGDELVGVQPGDGTAEREVNAFPGECLHPHGGAP
jgi:1,4-alpha-glucan branching enzyme